MRRKWTKKELDYLRRFYPDTPTRKIADRLNRSMRSVYAQAFIAGLVKSESFLRSIDSGMLHPGHKRGIKTQFKPGHRPHNKGCRGWDAGGRSSATRFKPGSRPHNWVPVGSERLTKEGILQRKISDTGCTPRDWKSIHSILWKEHHGPVPKGHIVVFINGDKRDIRIENLMLITRAENMRRNSIHHLPEEIADVCRVRGVLNRHINNRRKKDEKQD